MKKQDELKAAVSGEESVKGGATAVIVQSPTVRNIAVVQANNLQIGNSFFAFRFAAPSLVAAPLASPALRVR